MISVVQLAGPTSYLLSFPQVNPVGAPVGEVLPGPPVLPLLLPVPEDTVIQLLALALALVVAALVYVAACAFAPYTSCPKCTGRLRAAAPAGCSWCRGKGVRLRLGRRVFNAAFKLRNGLR